MLSSAYDNCQYQYTHLSNGLKVLIVHDVDCEKSAISLTVATGHFDDPPNLMGLSHLLEHMLFLGSSAFTEANQLSNFLGEIGGSINAATGTEHSSYFFDVPTEYLPQSIQRFASMIFQPLFEKGLIDKEINSIDAEFSLKQKDDLRRLYQVHKETCNPEHPFSKFSVGNNQTLRSDDLEKIQSALQEQHKGHYQPQNMAICLISNRTIVDCLTLLEDSFSSWENSALHTPTDLPPLYLPEQLGIQINIKPLKQARRLIVTFALPNCQNYYRSKPLNVISHMLGDEGKGSLLDYFKTKNWATNLSAGGGIEGSNFKDFNINLQLTEFGIDNVEYIINGIFYYLLLLKEHGLNNWRSEETKTLNQFVWDFGDAIKPIDEALRLSNGMFEYPCEHIVAGDYILDQPSPKIIGEILTFFNPNNMRLKVIHQGVSYDKKARWYNTPYSFASIDSKLLRMWLSPKVVTQLKLPDPNPYLQLSKQVQQFTSEFQKPTLIQQGKGLGIWFAQDHKFKLPKGDCFLSFDCEALSKTSLDFNDGLELVSIKRLWIALLNEKLNQQYYQANLAGLHFHLYPHQGGFSLQTNGFSSKQLTFCAELLTQISQNHDYQYCFEQVREKQWQGLRNSLLNKPINRLFSYLSVLMQRHAYSPMQMASVLEKTDLADIESVKNTLLDTFHLEAFVHGDWQIEQAKQFAEKLESFSEEHGAGKIIQRGVVDLRQNSLQVHKITSEQHDTAVVMFFQAPDSDLQNIALSILCEQLIAAPFFNQLRTEQQLGYLVGSGYMPFNQHPGLSFYIQSPTASAIQVVEAIHCFLRDMTRNIEQFATIWLSVKNGVIKQLQEKDGNLSMKSQRLWMAIGNNDLNFDQHTRLIHTIAQLEFSSLMEFMKALVNRQGFGELILYSDEHSNLGQELEVTSINDPNDFKMNSQYL